MIYNVGFFPLNTLQFNYGTKSNQVKCGAYDAVRFSYAAAMQYAYNNPNIPVSTETLKKYKDVMSKMLGVELRRFGMGKDGGIDLTNDTISADLYEKYFIVSSLNHYFEILDVENFSIIGKISMYNVHFICDFESRPPIQKRNKNELDNTETIKTNKTNSQNTPIIIPRNKISKPCPKQHFNALPLFNFIKISFW